MLYSLFPMFFRTEASNVLRDQNTETIWEDAKETKALADNAAENKHIFWNH